MGERIDPIKYTTNMREAWQDNDKEAVAVIEEKYGDQPVTLKDLEEVFSEAIGLLMTAYLGKDTIDEAKFNILLDTMHDKKIVDDNDYYNIIGEIKHLTNTIEGED